MRRRALSHVALTLPNGLRATSGKPNRRFATGPAASEKTVDDALLNRLGALSTQALVDGQWALGWPPSHIEGARALKTGMKTRGRAVTVRFVPTRPDIVADKPPAGDSPEYEAFELCGPDSVLVMSSVGPWESVGGDVKFLRLAQRDLGGLVTDGSVRDTQALHDYGFPVFSHSTTPRQGPHTMQPWEAQRVVQCGGVTVRPGDVVVGDDDGVVVIPAAVASEVADIAESREHIENVIKDQLKTEKCPPGKYYPFLSGKIKRESPLGRLLDSKGVRYASTSAACDANTPSCGADREPRFLHGCRKSTDDEHPLEGTDDARPFNVGGTPTSASGAAMRSSALARGFARSAASRRAAKAPQARGFAASAAKLPYTQTEAQQDAVLAAFAKHKACAVLRTSDGEFAPRAMEAAIEGGFEIVEFTLTTPGCLDLVTAFTGRDNGVLVGCGTIMSVDDAAMAMEAGAQFLVSPCLIPDVVEWAVVRNIVVIPGCATPSELYAAYSLGAQVQKIFPGISGGAGSVKAISAAMPMLKVNPTSGCDKDNVVEYLRAGASSVGFVAPAFPPGLMQTRDYDALVENARALITEVAKAETHGGATPPPLPSAD